MKSMTGYAALDGDYESINASVEIKGYNNRYLEVFVALPDGFAKHEAEVRRLASEYCRRGKVEVNVRIKNRESDFVVSIHKDAVASYVEAAETIAREAPSAALQFETNINIYQFMALHGVLEIKDHATADEGAWELIKPLFIETLEKFCADRDREGLHMEKAILSYIDAIEIALNKIALYVPQIELMIKENIRKRFDELRIECFDENRILAETAVLLMKYTIAEELCRLASHLEEFRSETKRNASPGKKLDFLSQEISREINTIGSKSALLEVSGLVVDMKDALENVREQLRNVE
jgi:uncharacterized protein (TIGR00255 family)